MRDALVTVAIDGLMDVKGLARIALTTAPWVGSRFSSAIASSGLLLRIARLRAALAAIACLDRLLAAFAESPVTRFFGELARGVRRIFVSPTRTATVLGFSAAIHLITIPGLFLLVKALALNFTLTSIVLIVPPLMELPMLTVSFGGWGVREGSMVVALSHMGLPIADGVARSILLGLTVTAVALPGRVLWRLQQGHAELPGPAFAEDAFGKRETYEPLH